ncbi:MAG: hypothetical protein LBN95_11325 [Prevotellaceae bacterium]|jgi:hypothetical protein|nr:hypothetical protein [Prevotellaceae bacterium]
MEILTTIQVLFPCAAVVLIGYWFINRPLQMEKLRLQNEYDKANSKIVTPIKLSAYERLVLFLERTSPDEILNRESEPNMSAFELQMRLLKVVREEFEHNVSQQIYVSATVWQAIVDAKNSINQLINICATQVSPNDRSINLAQIIIKAYNSEPNTATQNAISLLKNEIGKLIS